MLRTKVSLLLGAVVLSAIGTAASAHSIQIFTAPVITPNGLNSNYAYDVYLTPGNQVNSPLQGPAFKGDFFTLVDFTGYISVVSMPANWVLTDTSGVAVTPAGASPGTVGGNPVIATFASGGGEVVQDAAGTPDLTFQYTGPTNIINPAGGANLLLGTFVITSNKHGVNLAQSTIVGSDHQTSSTLPGQNADPYLNPGDSALPVPLPAAAWGGMSLLGALGAGKLIRRRK